MQVINYRKLLLVYWLRRTWLSRREHTPPEAQVDRLLKSSGIPPKPRSKWSSGKIPIHSTINAVASAAEVPLQRNRTLRQIYVDEKLKNHISSILFWQTRFPERYNLAKLNLDIFFYGSRASINLALASKAYAFLNKHIRNLKMQCTVCKYILRHRIGFYLCRVRKCKRRK
jgi:MoxR-like ATPase